MGCAAADHGAARFTIVRARGSELHAHAGDLSTSARQIDRLFALDEMILP